MNNYQAQLEAAIEAAHLAGSYQRYRFTSALEIEQKGDKDLVTEVDRESERLIVNHLLHSFPTYNVVAEEGRYLQGDSPFRWIIDPIDGTTNYAHGFPWFCVSIGLEFDDDIVAGVIYNPVQNELFTASKCCGAYLNGHPMSVSKRFPLQSTLLGTGFPYDCASEPDNNFDDFINFQKLARGIRRAGAAALDLAYVAAGRLDGFWELKLKPWDVAAGTLMVREAGGTVTTYDGSPYHVSMHRIVASNGLVHSEMIKQLGSSVTAGIN